jgi:hypothetical protein
MYFYLFNMFNLDNINDDIWVDVDILLLVSIFVTANGRMS